MTRGRPPRNSVCFPLAAPGLVSLVSFFFCPKTRKRAAASRFHQIKKVEKSSSLSRCPHRFLTLFFFPERRWPAVLWQAGPANTARTRPHAHAGYITRPPGLPPPLSPLLLSSPPSPVRLPPPICHLLRDRAPFSGSPPSTSSRGTHAPTAI